MKASMAKKHKKVEKHLREDMKMFSKERKEDAELIKTLKGNGMKKQSKASRMDESLGERRGKEASKKQSMKSRRDESKGSRKHEKKESKAYERKEEACARKGMKKAMRGR